MEYDWSGPDVDLTPRYAPQTIVVKGQGGMFITAPVVRTKFIPAFQHADYIRQDMGVLELTSNYGVRKYGCKHAYINSELRMVVIGTFRADEARMKWVQVPARLL